MARRWPRHSSRRDSSRRSGDLDLLASRRDPSELRDVLTAGVGTYVGHRVLYRVAFAAMSVEGFPTSLQIGRVNVHQAVGPLTTQRTTVVQRPGNRLVFEKTLHDKVVVADSVPLTVFTIADLMPEDIAAAFDHWHAEVLGAAGLLASLLDERVAQQSVLEDVVIFDAAGDAVGAADVRTRQRTFLPRTFSEDETVATRHLASSETAETSVSAAARWYLRGAQLGPVADAIVYFWIAIDALLGTEGNQVIPALRKALARRGFQLESLPISVGRLYGLRGEIVHKGVERPPELVDGYYELEAITRMLIRDMMGLSSSWPEQVALPWFPDRDAALVERRWRKPKTVWKRATRNDTFG